MQPGHIKVRLFSFQSGGLNLETGANGWLLLSKRQYGRGRPKNSFYAFL